VQSLTKPKRSRIRSSALESGRRSLRNQSKKETAAAWPAARWKNLWGCFDNVNAQWEIDHIVEWLQEQLRTTGTNGLVAGLSGGLDSSVTAQLIKRAAGTHSLGIIMPIHSNPEDALDAEAAAKAAGLRFYTLDLSSEHSSIMDASFAALHSLGVDKHPRMADANLRARLRMSALYVAANALGYLVVGTDNAAEFFTGYFTKFGDGACDILPLAEFTKSEVRELGQALGVPAQILQRAPSAGLWEGQTDEGEMGLSYAVIDDYLKGRPVPSDEKERIERMHKNTEHKRSLPPIYHRR